MFMRPIWAVKISPSTSSGPHSWRGRLAPTNRPVAAPHSVITTPPSRNRIQARRSGGASSRPSLIATVLPPQNSETSSASAMPRRSRLGGGWLRGARGGAATSGSWMGVHYNPSHEDRSGGTAQERQDDDVQPADRRQRGDVALRRRPCRATYRCGA